MLYVCSISNSQIDTLSISAQINSFKTSKDHKQFWKTIYRHDQSFRGKETVDSNDLRNIVKASMYFNKFGYPSTEIAGKESSIINYVWVHNSTPKIDELTFSIIIQGYLNRSISEEELRNYYIRSIYSRKFVDEEYKTESIKHLLDKLELHISQKININKILMEYEKSQSFLTSEHKEYGLWKGETTFDTLYYNEKPIINKNIPDPIRIFIDSSGNYYLHYLYEDRSYYPQKLIYEENNIFKLFIESKSYYKVLDNGNLEFVDSKGRTYGYTPHNK